MMTQERMQQLWDQQLLVFEETEEVLLEVKELQAELTRLKTPHPCAECDYLQFNAMVNRWFCSSGTNGVGSVAPHYPWLCGHFKAKGTK